MGYATPVLVCVLLTFAACQSAGERNPAGEGSSAPSTQPVPATVTLADVQRLRWIEGTWRGSEDEGEPFFESYEFLNDSTIQTRTFTDSTRAQVADSGRIALSRGVLTSHGGDAVWVVTEIDSTRVHFEPQENARNAFTWTRESPSSWSAVLRWTSGSGEAQERAYRMERIGEAESE